MDHKTLPSSADLDEKAAAGFQMFWKNAALSTCEAGDQQRGWWLAHRHAYAEGYHSAAIGDDAENPHPQFSGAWEAWGDGHNDGMAVFHGE